VDRKIIYERLTENLLSGCGWCDYLLSRIVASRGRTPRPLYASIPPERHSPSNAASDGLLLNGETRAAPAESVDDSLSRFSARVAEAIRWTTNHSDFPPPKGLNFLQDIQPEGDNNEQSLGWAILAKMAYKDYFTDDAKGDKYRKGLVLVLVTLQ
jgi:hypothetical protein